MNDNNTTERITFRAPLGWKKKLDSLSKGQDRKMSSLIRRDLIAQHPELKAVDNG